MGAINIQPASVGLGSGTATADPPVVDVEPDRPLGLLVVEVDGLVVLAEAGVDVAFVVVFDETVVKVVVVVTGNGVGHSDVSLTAAPESTSEEHIVAFLVQRDMLEMQK
jgi:hypothetical protein